MGQIKINRPQIALMVEMVAVGKSWKEVSKAMGISRRSFANILTNNKAFRAAYDAAKMACADYYVDKCLTEATAPFPKDLNPKMAGAFVQRQRLIVDTFMRVAGKLKPHQWGDKVEVQHSGSVEVSPLAQLRALGANVGGTVIEAEIVEDTNDCF